jgi:mannose-6-phosphate isomerase
LCEGTLVLETQQSSDTTYRVYDYDRKDADGNLRELHLEKAIEVTTIPHQGNVTVPKIDRKENVTMTSYVESEFFSVYKWDVFGKSTFAFNDQYLLFSVIKGEGTLVHQGETYQLTKGTHFIIPVGFGEFQLDGDCQLIVSHP